MTNLLQQKHIWKDYRITSSCRRLCKMSSPVYILRLHLFMFFNLKPCRYLCKSGIICTSSTWHLTYSSTKISWLLIEIYWSLPEQWVSCSFHWFPQFDSCEEFMGQKGITFVLQEINEMETARSDQYNVFLWIGLGNKLKSTVLFIVIILQFSQNVNITNEKI